MTETRQQDSVTGSLFDLLQDAYRNRRTGLVRRSHRGVESERYFVVKGELYLPRDHPLSLSIERQLLGKTARAAAVVAYDTQPVDTGNVPRAVLESGLRILVEILTDSRSVGFEYARGATEIPMNVVGPLPTAELLMEASVRGLDELELLRRLGGEEQEYVSRRDELAESGPDIDPQQAFLISRSEKPITVRELLRQTEVDRELALAKLVRLAAVGLIERPSGERAAAPQRRRARRRDQVVERLEERVWEELERRPLELDEEEHRAQILELLGSYGDNDFYTLLGVEPQATSEDVHAAYSDWARITHPGHAEGLGLGGGAAPLRVLFETLTDAYLTLSDGDRRRDYQLKLGMSFGPGGAGLTEEERAIERAELAHRNFVIARDMANRQDFHSAIELLNVALKSDPQAEYYTLLAQCQEQNPQWLAKAIGNYERALALDGESLEARRGLAKAYEDTGQAEAAREQYKLLKAVGGDVVAAEGDGPADADTKRGGRRGLLGRLFSSLRSDEGSP